MLAMDACDSRGTAAPLPRADLAAPRAIIRNDALSATQSARRRFKPWRLELRPSVAPPIDPLMGWTGDRDTCSQVELRFDTLEAAMAFARRRGWAFEVGAPADPSLEAAKEERPTAAEAESALLSAFAQ
jgi:hypothetical protein